MDMRGYYIVLSTLGKGGFGVVYKVYNSKKQNYAAMKIVKSKHQKYIKKESYILKLLKNEKGYPRLLARSSTKMVMTVLGEPLSINMKLDIGAISSMMLYRIRILHQYGYIHNDIKLSNFLLGPTNDEHNVYLIDFGLSKKYIDSKNNHIEMSKNEMFRGTVSMSSPNILRGYTSSRRDDLISLGYCVIKFYKKLPWYEKKHRSLSGYELANIKNNTSELKKNIPDPIQKYIDIVYLLKFKETPPYKKLDMLLKQL